MWNNFAMYLNMYLKLKKYYINKNYKKISKNPKDKHLIETKINRIILMKYYNVWIL